MDFVKYGIIGSGTVWRFHKFGCRNNPKIKFKAVFDINEKIARRCAKVNKMTYCSTIDDFQQS